MPWRQRPRGQSGPRALCFVRRQMRRVSLEGVRIPAAVSLVIALVTGCHSGTLRSPGSHDAAPDSATADDGGRAASDTTAADDSAPRSQDDAASTDGELTAQDAATADTSGNTSDAARVWMPGPSCAGLAPTCGPNGTSDCCASSVIPGGTFNRGNDPMWPATVSDFRLDVYEITVGRLRAFVEAYPANRPAPGSGRNPNDPTDTGWDASWTALLPADATELRKQINCKAQLGFTWTDSPSTHENLPANCITFFVAQAFCIWDGGRLPTDAEWNYAAAGGAEQRYYAWSTPADSQTIDPSYAVYGTSTTTMPVSPVGSRSPRGDGKWGQADLAGNVCELTRDQLDLQAPGLGYPLPCSDCISAAPVATTKPGGSDDAIHGGGFYNGYLMVQSSSRQNIGVVTPEADVGARCARAP